MPRPAGSQEVAAARLRISNGHYFSASEEKRVLIRRAGTGTFIQTDKPTYNPGQTGEQCMDHPDSGPASTLLGFVPNFLFQIFQSSEWFVLCGLHGDRGGQLPSAVRYP